MNTHELKIWPEYFQAVQEGIKTHEIRVNDRDFHVGDVLVLLEWFPSCHTFGEGASYTGRKCEVEVTYITRGGQFGIRSDMVVMSIRRREQ